MTNIHHATAKRAANAGFEIAIDESNGTATCGGFSTTLSAVTVAVDRAIEHRNWQIEYPGVQIEQESGTFAIQTKNDDGEWTHIDDQPGWETWPALADVLDAYLDANIDPEAGFEEEPEGGSVVSEVYKKLYATTPGKKSHSGDWLACELEGHCDLPSGAFDPGPFEAILEANSVKLEGKWYAAYLTGAHGSAGRMRMNGSQKLRIEIAYHGKLYIPTSAGGYEEILPPEEWIATIEAKHAKLFAKRRTLEAKVAA